MKRIPDAVMSKKNYLSVGTAGTACFATSAPLPFNTSTDLKSATYDALRLKTYTNAPVKKTRTLRKIDTTPSESPQIQTAYPTGNGRVRFPPKSPGPRTSRLAPNTMLHSLKRERVQKGRRKSWWSMWGGMQSPSSYMLMMQLSGTQEGGSTCHLISRLIVVRRRGGMGSTTSSRIIPGGFPFLSCRHSLHQSLPFHQKSRPKVKYHPTTGTRSHRGCECGTCLSGVQGR